MISWSDTEAGRYELCWNCGLVVAQVEDDTAPLATVADALTWTDATSEVIFGRGGDRREEWADLRVWAVVGRIASWQITSEGPCPSGARENCDGLTAPLIAGYTAATVAAGDLVVVRGRVRRVVGADKTTATVGGDHSGNGRVPWHEVSDRVTGISVPDPDAGPEAMPIYEGLTPETGLVDGSYLALLSTERRSEPLEVAITITDSRLTALATPPALITPTPPHP